MISKKKPVEDMRHSSNGTFGWKQKTENRPRVQRFRTSLLTTKTAIKNGLQSTYEAVVMPEGQDEIDAMHEWIAENLVDFFNEIAICFQANSVSNKGWDEICEHPETAPNFGFPPGVVYFWKDNKTQKAVQLPVQVYVDQVLEWVGDIMENEETFPSEQDVKFAENFKTAVAQPIYKRLFRILAIIYSNPCLCNIEPDGQPGQRDKLKMLHSTFKRFMFFGWEYQLLVEKELECIADVVEEAREKYIREKEAYRKKLKANEDI